MINPWLNGDDLCGRATFKRPCAAYERLEDGTFYGEIPTCQGVMGNATPLEACCEDLQSALAEWLILGLRLGHTLPILDGIDSMLIPLGHRFF